MKETLASMAVRLGCSQTTISRVLNGKGKKYRISDATVKKVLAEAQRCKYSTSLVAHHLRKNKTESIGLLIPSVANPFFADMASVIISEAHSRNYVTIIVDMQEDGSNQDEALAALLERQVDGVIVVPCADNPTLLEEIDRTVVPVVLVDRYYENIPLSYVTTNNYKGGLLATELMLENRHKRIACVQGFPNAMPTIMRVKGYCDAMEKAGLADNELIVGGEFSTQNGYLETKLLLGENPRPTAIFALSNTILLGAIKAIREAGLKIPEDISVISFDNNRYLDYMVPPIHRIGQPVEDMAILASRILFEKINGNNPEQVRRLALSPKLIAGESVCPCRE
ncbi:MAG: LacI family DNA-binding transcriptional regulator [Bacteroidales bacterium]|nr:LacI family DNA-binding transcriptional regulator [Bacteroidales bacterium]